MTRTSDSLDSSEGSHFSGRPPPPYHLVDVTKQFWFNYATAASQVVSDVRDSGSEAWLQEQDSALSTHESSDSLVRRWRPGKIHSEDPGSATPLPDGSRSVDAKVSNRVLDLAQRTAVNEEPVTSIYSSEDGGALLPSRYGSDTTDVLDSLRLGNTLTTPKWYTPRALVLQQRPEATAVLRAASTTAPLRARIEATLIGRGLSAATNHQQYAMYRRQYDRNRSLPAIDMPKRPADIDIGLMYWILQLSARDFNKCSEPWALSSIVSWLKDVLDGRDPERTVVLMILDKFFSYKASDPSTRAHPSLLSRRVFETMISSGTLVLETVDSQFGSGVTTGVLVELTGGGCYTSLAHRRSDYSCYSPRCLTRDHIGAAMDSNPSHLQQMLEEQMMEE